jgi:hypothetical protein
VIWTRSRFLRSVLHQNSAHFSENNSDSSLKWKSQVKFPSGISTHCAATRLDKMYVMYYSRGQWVPVLLGLRCALTSTIFPRSTGTDRSWVFVNLTYVPTRHERPVWIMISIHCATISNYFLHGFFTRRKVLNVCGLADFVHEKIIQWYDVFQGTGPCCFHGTVFKKLPMNFSFIHGDDWFSTTLQSRCGPRIHLHPRVLRFSVLISKSTVCNSTACKACNSSMIEWYGMMTLCFYLPGGFSSCISRNALHYTHA